MKTITLNENQVCSLIRDKYFDLNESQSLDISNDQLFLNTNGYTSEVFSVTFEFEERIIENRGTIDYIKNLICFQLNLDPCEVIFFSRTNDEFQFKIRIGSNISNKIVVYERRRAEWNTAYNEDSTYNLTTNTIGPYRQLSNSAYYFRWLDE